MHLCDVVFLLTDGSEGVGVTLRHMLTKFGFVLFQTTDGHDLCWPSMPLEP